MFSWFGRGKNMHHHALFLLAAYERAIVASEGEGKVLCGLFVVLFFAQCVVPIARHAINAGFNEDSRRFAGGWLPFSGGYGHGLSRLMENTFVGMFLNFGWVMVMISYPRQGKTSGAFFARLM